MPGRIFLTNLDPDLTRCTGKEYRSRSALAGGRGRGLFAYALGEDVTREFDTIQFKKRLVVDECELSETAWLLRPALAKEPLPGPETVTTGGTATGSTTSLPDAVVLWGICRPKGVHAPSRELHLSLCVHDCTFLNGIPIAYSLG